VVLGVLLVSAFVTRRDGLPDDGLWFDDSWVAAGAVRGSLSQFFAVGSGHPGFTTALMAVSRLTDGSSSALAYPSLVAGTLGPPLVYLALRWFGYAPSIGALVAAALVVGDHHIIYSGRVKSYVIDTLIVLGLAVIVPRLARMKWRPGLGLAWFAAATIVGSFSGFALAATGVAGVILVLHPASDRGLRIAAVAAQAVAQFALFVKMQRSSDLARIERHQESIYDGHLEFDPNPVRFGAEVLEHLKRIAAVFPGGPDWWLTISVFVVLAGLVGAALTKRKPVLARYLALILFAAFVGGLAGRFPFGPEGGGGERATLWLVPIMAVGLAIALGFVRGLIATRAPLRLGFDLVAFVSAAIVVLSAIGDEVSYPWPGSKSATEFIEAELDENDAVIITQTSVYTYAVESNSDVSARATPERIIGFIPEFSDHRLHAIGTFAEGGGTPGAIRRRVDGADRVFVHIGIPFIAGAQLRDVRNELVFLGYEEQRTEAFGAALVQIWRQ
jgi:hypothetical protein